MKKAMNYLEAFTRFKSDESVQAVERSVAVSVSETFGWRRSPRLLKDGSAVLHNFEAAQLGTLCCEEAEEAKTLIPSLAEKVSDDTLQSLLDELSSFRKFES